MVSSLELNALGVKQVGSLAKKLGVIGWHEMKKADLVRAVSSKSRSKSGGDIVSAFLVEAAAHPKPEKKSAAKKQENSGSASADKNDLKEKLVPVRREMKTLKGADKEDRMTLLVRGPFWLHAFWELNSKTIERAKAAMGHLWYTAVPVLRLFKLDTDSTGQQRKQFLRNVFIHGNVNNWYLDVSDPPAVFQTDLGFVSREKKFYSLIVSNIVKTPQQHTLDDPDQLDGNWRGIADDLGRVFKLSGGDSSNPELKKVFEEQLKRPMSATLLSRYRVSQQETMSERTQRNFQLDVNVDVIIYGKTDPSVQLSIREEPIELKSDGSFAVRFAIPEKRHVFPIEAEGSDGVEVQRVILTMDRNTRILETLFQEPVGED